MASNSFGSIFKITTWGESHGKAIGVVIDGCPAGLEISEDEINLALSLRAPGQSPYTSPRCELDAAQILSGVFEGRTTGAPISIMILNQNVDSSKYEPIKNLLRPGHANYTYLEKYGIFDYRGGGRSSARETACRVAAGAIAKKLLEHYHIQLKAYIKQIGPIEAIIEEHHFETLSTLTSQSPIFCPDPKATSTMTALIEQAKKEGDSLGGVIEFIAFSLPTGLGDPVYEKLEAKLAYAMMSLPATKAFEIGSGFYSASMCGSEHNDLYTQDVANRSLSKFALLEKTTPFSADLSGNFEDISRDMTEKLDGKEAKNDCFNEQMEFRKGSNTKTMTNFSGGTLGGISTGMPLIGRVAFKPTSSIMKPQETLTLSGEKAIFQLPQGSKHDPCVAIRAVPIVEAMAALVLADALLLNRCVKL